MAAESPLHLLLFWHQHQPLYKDGLRNRYEMPWVRLHATKDYYDMAAVLEEFPKVKANFNLVPSLLTQLDDYAEGRAQDRFLEVTLKPAAELTFDDRQFLLQNFFMAHWEHMIDPYPRYKELLEKRGRHTTSESFSRIQTYFKEQDWRDLQTWFNLTWFDPWWREKDPFLRGLFEKGKNFSEDDKKKLVERQIQICGQIVAKHKELQDKGQIEVTTTPFYHPILPLLCDSDVARTAMPQATLPTPKFHHPEDSQEQLRRAVEDYQRRFGRAPKGLWPSEGSVSDDAVARIMDQGLEWIATDEGIVQRSLGKEEFKRTDLYRPYRYTRQGKSIRMYFRDHELSDAIGFVYATWDPEAAAQDFMKRLRQRKKDVDSLGHPAIVSVVLDGENCWEYYAQDGLPFLRALYRQLSEATDIVTVRGADYAAIDPEPPILAKIWPGSWINSNFAIWIGHREDNEAWSRLLRTRRYLEETIRDHPELQGTAQAQNAWEEIYIAEGSDWCWWYGEDHSSANDAAFDLLFRKHLMNVYTLMGGKAPDDLHTPIKRSWKPSPIQDPVDFITPTLDGRVTGYFEWRAAGFYQTETGGTGTMQKSENRVQSIHYGYDRQKMFVRVDFNMGKTTIKLEGITLKMRVKGSDLKEIDLRLGEEGKILARDTRTPNAVEFDAGRYAKIAEIGLPLELLGLTPDQPVEWTLILMDSGRELERWPQDSTFKIPYPAEEAFALNWRV